MNPVFLLTDFGTDDTYVGQMKAVLQARAPGCVMVDLTHAIGPQDVAGGARALASVLPHLPRPSVVLAVVDPGVGTPRRPIVVEVDGVAAVGPDNGLLSPLLAREGAAVTRLEPADVGAGELSATFHGRDLFAPAAAALTLGWTTPASRRITDAILLDDAGPLQTSHGWLAHVVDVDRFGNLITDLPGERLESPEDVSVQLPDGSAVKLKLTYGQAADGELLALVGSGGHLEIACAGGSAAVKTGLGRGARIRVETRG